MPPFFLYRSLFAILICEIWFHEFLILIMRDIWTLGQLKVHLFCKLARIQDRIYNFELIALFSQSVCWNARKNCAEILPSSSEQNSSITAAEGIFGLLDCDEWTLGGGNSNFANKNSERFSPNCKANFHTCFQFFVLFE